MLQSELNTLGDLLTSLGFLGGLVAGLTLLIMFALSPSLRGNRTFGFAAWAAVVLAGALYLDFGRRLGLLAGLVIMVTSGWAHGARSDEKTGGLWDISLLGIVIGALVFAARSGLDAPPWATWGVAAFTIGVGLALLRWRALGLGTLIGPTIGIAAIGMWATIPDTDMARVLLGTTLPLMVVTLRPIEARVTAAGAFALPAMVAWIVVQGGIERPASVVGGWACFAFVLIVALVVRMAPVRARGGAATFLLLHAIIVLVSSRAIGLGHGATPAMSWALGLSLLGALALRFTLVRAP